MANQLNRTLTFGKLVFLGLAFMTMMIVFTTYGIVSQRTQGMVAASYVIVLIAMLFNVYSYGKMVKIYPLAGSAYAFAQKSIHPAAGFFVGWSIMMDYLLTPMLNYLVVGVYLYAAFPVVPIWAWIILFICIITLINIMGVTITANINFLLVGFQVLVIVIFIALSVKSIIEEAGTGTLFSSLPFNNPDVPFSDVTAGAAILFLSFLGFDTITTFSEETINPTKTLPKAMFAIVLIGGGSFIFLSYIIQQVHPDFLNFNDLDAAGFEVVAAVTGNIFTSVFLAGYVVACFASALVSHAGVSRFLFAMGRDGVFSKKIFGYVSPKLQVPIFNILIVSGISLLALVAHVDIILAFINFGVLVAFMFVNLSVIFHYYIKDKTKKTLKKTFLFLLIPIIGLTINFWLWTNLGTETLMIGGIWLTIGVIYLAFLTKMFRKPIPVVNLEETPSAETIKESF